MGLEKRTIKIIVIVVIILLIIGGVVGLLLGLLLPYRFVDLEVWPRSEESYHWEQPLIEFRQNDPGSWHPWVRRINEFLSVYETSVPDEPNPRAPCSAHHRHEQRLRAPTCDLAMHKWKPCTADYHYGFDQGQPCVFLRLSNIHYWVPEPYNMSVRLSVPTDLPKHIYDAMQSEHHQPHLYGGNRDYVWVSCDGEFPADKENVGPVQYRLRPGFEMNKLHTADKIPYAARSQPERDPGPLVAVWFENPRRGVLINVECKVWTRDLEYYRSYTRVGKARFELFVE